MIDAHCHLADLRIYERASEIVENSKRIGITHLIQAGVNPSDWERQSQLQNKFGSAIQIVAGIHPYEIVNKSIEDIKLLLEKLEIFCRSNGVCAVGEIGFDFREAYAPDQSTRALQSDATLIQIRYANQIQKPCVFHIVRAHDEALKLLQLSTPKWGGMIHSFNAQWSVAKRYLDLGLMLSIGPSILKSKTESLGEVIKKMPLDSLLIESDSPDQAPHGQKINAPKNIRLVAQACAQASSHSVQDILEKTAQNAKRLFALAT
jgi:TatD DNase family protein